MIAQLFLIFVAIAAMIIVFKEYTILILLGLLAIFIILAVIRLIADFFHWGKDNDKW